MSLQNIHINAYVYPVHHLGYNIVDSFQNQEQANKRNGMNAYMCEPRTGGSMGKRCMKEVTRTVKLP